jgi:RHS repeat-associated protein
MALEMPQASSIGSPVSALGNRYTFQGREIDWTTGLMYFRARWYNPETGRWLSKDPIRIAGGLNLYAFCDNNPVNFVDPMGLCKEKKGEEKKENWFTKWLKGFKSGAQTAAENSAGGAAGGAATVASAAVVGPLYHTTCMNAVTNNARQQAVNDMFGE